MEVGKQKRLTMDEVKQAEKIEVTCFTVALSNCPPGVQVSESRDVLMNAL